MKSKESEFAMMNSKGIISQIFKIKDMKYQNTNVITKSSQTVG